MNYQSILYADTTPQILQSPPVYFQDLQLEYLIGIMEQETRGYHIRPHFYTLPASMEVIQYRQQICQDLSDDGLYHHMEDFCLGMQRSRRSHALSLQCEEEIQRASYHLEAASHYWQSILVLTEKMGTCHLNSPGFLSFQDFLAQEIRTKRESGFEQALQQAQRFFSQIKFQLFLEGDRITITEGTGETENFLADLADLTEFDPSPADLTISGIFPNLLEPSCLETTLVQLLKKSNPVIFREIRKFYIDFPEYYCDRVLQFEEEIPVYLGFLKFREKTEKLGYPMQQPQISPSREFHGRGIYDIALVWKNAGRDYEVVSNDFSYPARSSFFVVTGPNQGGKTTFARSMGQAVYFSMMGFHANAAELVLPYFHGISTHFEVEERLQSNSGKLKEEISRLAPMMKKESTDQFVILNELFTTATTHDARIMGREVMDHFLKRDCYGIYVTHIQELAEEKDQIISLVAQIENEEDKKRTYRMLPMKAKGYGYSDSLVKEFSLSYEDIKRRLSQ